MGKRRTRTDLGKLLRACDHVPLEDLPTDRPWRAAVTAFLRDNDITQTTLGSWVNASQSVISNLISEENKSFRPRSEYVARVGEATGIGLPVTARIELAAHRLADAGHREAAAAAALQLEALVEHLVGKR